MSTGSLLDRFHRDLLSRIMSASYFDTITLIDEDKGTTETEVDEAVSLRIARAGKKPGLVIIVFRPQIKRRGETPGPVRIAHAWLRIIEVPKINRAAGGTRLVSTNVMDELTVLLDLLPYGNSGCWYVEDPVPFNDTKGGQGWDVPVRWSYAMKKRERCTQPAIAFAGGNATLTVGTAGATILYSLDDSYPLTGAAGTSTYTVPFAVTTGQTLRVVAHKSGLQDSGAVETLVP